MMAAPRRSRLLLSPSRLLLLHLPFRLLRRERRGGPGFAPGLRASFAWSRRMLWHGLIDIDRLKYRLVRLRQRLRRRRR